MIKNNHHYKKAYDNAVQKIKDKHCKGASGIETAIGLTKCRDSLLHAIFQSLENNKQYLTIVALGGYGRKELCFSSDTDIMFLIEDEQYRDVSTDAVREYIHKLLDVGLNVGHSYRTVEECISLPLEDIESQMSLLEARFICGNDIIHKKLISGIQNKIQENDYPSFVRRLTDIQFVRHNKYGNSAKLLEPNIKNSEGGLRDIHTALWLLAVTNSVRAPIPLGRNETAILAMLKSSLVKKQFAMSFIQSTRKAFDSLLRIRNEMHLQSKTIHDTLEFSFQPQIASHLKYNSHAKRTKTECFMQDYYIASRSIAIFSSRMVGWANDKWAADDFKKKKKFKRNEFSLYGKRIYLNNKYTSISNAIALKALLLRSDYGAEFSFNLDDSIYRHHKRIKPLSGKMETSLFRLLMQRPNGVGSSLRKMSELRLLEKWIPEWQPMVSFFQHNQYHFYTADEHTLIAIINAEELTRSNSTFAKVFHSLARRDILYLACLMHDIAKPRHIGKHEILGVGVSKHVLKRLGFDDIAEDVAFLVRHHLLMEQVAFRRNLSDPQTIAEFAGIFYRIELLDYLYVLTYADLSAVNRNVLTGWKEHLLWELYRKTRAVLEDEMTVVQIHSNNVKEIERYQILVTNSLMNKFPKEEIETHLLHLKDTSYLVTFNTEAIELHLNAIRTRQKVTTLFQQSENYSDVTFIVQDAAGLLSKLCGVLTANDANILDAQVFTRTDGVVIDKFRVTDFVTHKCLSDEICQKISNDIEKVISNTIQVTSLIERHQTRWKRRTKPLNPNVRCDVVFEEHPQFTIIDVFAPDMLGFLYRITEKLSELDLNIKFAKIATRVDGIVDSFYLLDKNENKIDDPERRKIIKQEILTTIASLCNSQLILSSLKT